MKVKNLFVIPILFLMTWGFMSCNDNPHSTFFFREEPAIVYDLSGDSYPVIKTAYGNFSVPELVEKNVEEGDLLWTTYFYVTTLDITRGDSLVAQDFRYEEVNEKPVALPENTELFNKFLDDDYSDSIQLAKLYPTYVERYLFFGFYHEDTASNDFIYEIVCNPEIEAANGHPTLYIRAKKALPEELRNSPGISISRIIAAFDMHEFVEKYILEVSHELKLVRFNIKYKTGIDSEGNDIYREFLSNPITWTPRE